MDTGLKLELDLLGDMYSRKRLVALVVAVVVVAVILAWASTSSLVGFPDPACRGNARCFTGTVVGIVDGDTLDIGEDRIRLALVDTPEAGEAGYDGAKAFTANTCPVGSTALVDEDDGQTGGSYGRILARVFCRGVNLNAALVGEGHARVLTQFCGVSEFSDEPWAAACG